MLGKNRRVARPIPKKLHPGPWPITRCQFPPHRFLLPGHSHPVSFSDQNRAPISRGLQEVSYDSFADAVQGRPLVLPFNVLVARLSIGTAAVRQDVKADSKRPEPLPTFSQVLDWLPPDTETLMVCQGSYTLDSPRPDDEKEPEHLPLEKYLQRMSYGALLTCVSDGVCLKHLTGREVVLGVEGSRHFRPAGGLGENRYEGCHVLVFQHRRGDALRESLSAEAKKVLRLAGQEVFAFEKKLENDLWTFFIAIPKPNVLVCATHAGYLEQVLRRMAEKGRKAGKRAFPEDLAEWRYVDKAAHFWAIRHYTEESGADGQVTGLVFRFDPGRGARNSKRAKVIYLSTVEKSEKRIAEEWTYHGERTWKPRVKRSAPGVIEITAELKHEGDAGRFLFVLLFHLGHAIAC